MSENKKHTSMSKLSQKQIAADQLGVDLADAAFLHDAGYPGITPEQLKERWADAKLLGRNAVEEALGLTEPYGSGGTYVADAQARNNNPPAPE